MQNVNMVTNGKCNCRLIPVVGSPSDRQPVKRNETGTKHEGDGKLRDREEDVVYMNINLVTQYDVLLHIVHNSDYYHQLLFL